MSQPSFVPLGLSPSFGFGDRTGLATEGHALAVRRNAAFGIAPIFCQQSVREMVRTCRTPLQVVDDALNGMHKAGWIGPAGADADHLKSLADVNAAFEAGFTFYTIDPSGHVDDNADDFPIEVLRERYAEIADEVAWILKYDFVVRLATGTHFELSDVVRMRAAVKYGRAVNAAIYIADHIRRLHEEAGRDYEIELSVDETKHPTTLQEHFIIASECLEHGMKLVSIAPRFLGDFEKGVDYKGDISRLEHSLADHAEIAKTLGPYKLGLHSGSDKLSIYPMLARATGGRFHVKTSGTSYLEALRVVAWHEPVLFRSVVSRSRHCYAAEKATYHVSAQLSNVPPPEELSDDRVLERTYLGWWDDVPVGRGFDGDGRQILHCTYSAVLTDDELGPALKSVLRSHSSVYKEVLVRHFTRHLERLEIGMPL